MKALKWGHMHSVGTGTIRKLGGDTQRRYGNTAAGRSYLAQASASLMDAVDSVAKAREALR